MALGFLVAFALAPMVASGLPPAGTIVVEPTAMDSWAFLTSGTASTAFASGPGTPPMGTGSVSFSVGTDGDSGAQIRSTAFSDVALEDLTSLGYATYTSAWIDGQVVYIILNLDLNGDGVLDDLLFFEPVYQNGDYNPSLPDQPDVALNAWQTWDALSGGWWSLNGVADAGPGTGVKSISEYLAAEPDATIVNTPSGLGGVRLVAGFGAGAWDNFLGNADAFAIGVSGTVTVYDFEAAPAPVHLDIGSDGTFDFGFTEIQPAVDLAGDGDTVVVAAGTYPELVVVTDSIHLLGARAGVDARFRSGPESVVGTTDGAFQILADNVEINGFTIQGVVGASGISSLGAGVWTAGENAGHLIQNNIIRDNTMGIFLNSDGTFVTVVHQNLFVDNNEAGAASGDAIYSDINARNIAIQNNRFTGHASAAMVFAGGFLPGSAQVNIQVTDNAFVDDAGSAVFFTAEALTITGNTWTNSAGSSLALGPGVHDVLITGNEFLDGATRGLRILEPAIFGIPGDVSDVAAHGNSFVGNALAGVEVAAGAYDGTMDAECNWWGEVTGPTIASNIGGTGDVIVDPDEVVDYAPFLGLPVPGGCPGPVHLDLASDGDFDIDFLTIQDAVDLASAGDTIYVDSGTYTEQVTISGPSRNGLTLKPTSPLTTVTIAAPTSMAEPKAIVRVSGAQDVVISGFTIAGPGGGGCNSIRSGIRVDDGGSALIEDNHIVDIRDEPFSGCQNGVGVFVGRQAERTFGSATIVNNVITGHQKGGIVVDNDGSTATIAENMILGAGPTDVIAQNGVQVSRGATGTIRDNVIAGHSYTPKPETACGILVFDSDPGLVRRSRNTFHFNGLDNEMNVCVVPAVGVFTLGGTAEIAADPVNSMNHAVRMDTSAAGSFGFARRDLGVPISALTGLITLDYYLDDRDCGGGSPRIQLAIDTDGDGLSNGNAHGYIGPSPSFTGCTMNVWQDEDLTDAVTRWDLTQFGGPFYNTWSEVLAFFGGMPTHVVLRGGVYDDSAWLPSASGVVYFDHVRIGDEVLAGPSDLA